MNGAEFDDGDDGIELGVVPDYPFRDDYYYNNSTCDFHVEFQVWPSGLVVEQFTIPEFETTVRKISLQNKPPPTPERRGRGKVKSKNQLKLFG